jgi:hypothetical protein
MVILEVPVVVAKASAMNQSHSDPEWVDGRMMRVPRRARGQQREGNEMGGGMERTWVGIGVRAEAAKGGCGVGIILAEAAAAEAES